MIQATNHLPGKLTNEHTTIVRVVLLWDIRDCQVPAAEVIRVSTLVSVVRAYILTESAGDFCHRRCYALLVIRVTVHEKFRLEINNKQSPMPWRVHRKQAHVRDKCARAIRPEEGL